MARWRLYLGNAESAPAQLTVESPYLWLIDFAASEAGGGTGTVTATLDAVTLSSDADLFIQATATPTLGDVTLSSDADLFIQATLDATLAALTATTDADLLIQATLDASLDAVTLSADGDLLLQATATPTLDDVVLTSEADLFIQATLDATLGDVTLEADGSLDAVPNGEVDATLDDVTLSSEADLFLQASATPTLADVTLSSEADLFIQGSLDATLGDVTGSSGSDLFIQATLDATLDDVTLSSEAVGPSASVGDVVVTLGDVTCESYAPNSIGGGSTRVPRWDQSVVDIVTGKGKLVLPIVVVSGTIRVSGGTGKMRLPGLRALGSGYVERSGNAGISCPVPIVRARGAVEISPAEELELRRML